MTSDPELCLLHLLNLSDDLGYANPEYPRKQGQCGRSDGKLQRTEGRQVGEHPIAPHIEHGDAEHLASTGIEKDGAAQLTNECHIQQNEADRKSTRLNSS